MNGFEKRTFAKKEQLLQAVLEIINHPSGIKALTIQKLVDTTHISRATIFKYYASKDQLLKQAFIYYLDQMNQQTHEILAQKKDFIWTFQALTQLKITAIHQREQQFYLDLMAFYTQKKDATFAKAMEDYTKQAYDLMKTLFQQGRKEGAISSKYTDEFLLLYFQCLVEGFSQPHIYQQTLAYTKEWSEVVLKGFAP